METGMWNHMLWATTWTRVRGKFGANRSKESGRSGASFTSQKSNTSATHFFTLCPKPRARFHWKRARLSLFRPQPHLPNFIQIHPSFRELLAKTTFQIVTIIGDPIGYRIADNNSCHCYDVTTGLAIYGFLWVVNLNQSSNLRGLRDMEPQRFLIHDLDRVTWVIGHKLFRN